MDSPKLSVLLSSSGRGELGRAVFSVDPHAMDTVIATLTAADALIAVAESAFRENLRLIESNRARINTTRAMIARSLLE
jgi:hypothetical protein